MKLTKSAIQKLELSPGIKDKIFFDDALPCFGLRIREGGKRTWVVQYRLGAKQRRITIGKVETLDVDEARKEARKALSKTHLGHDPQVEKGEARKQASVTLASVGERYLTEHAKTELKPRSFVEVERHLRRHWSALAQIPITSLTRSDVSSQLSKITKESGPIAANRARAALSALFAWAMAEGLSNANPVVGTKKATERPRERVLSKDELQLIWANAGTGDYGDIVRLLILTGQRREEVGAMTWAELDLDNGVWRIGRDRTKNARSHDVPLTEPALCILRARDRSHRRDLVFGAADGAFQGWSNAKAALDKRIEGYSGTTITPWRLHDIRRTVATRLADLGVLPHVIEAVLNHVSGHKAGVAGIYNRSTYATEKRDALAAWAAHVTRLTSLEGESCVQS